MDGGGEKGPIGVRIPVRRGPRPCQPHLIANLCQFTDIKRQREPLADTATALIGEC